MLAIAESALESSWTVAISSESVALLTLFHVHVHLVHLVSLFKVASGIRALAAIRRCRCEITLSRHRIVIKPPARDNDDGKRRVALLHREGSPLIVVRPINREEAVRRRFAVSHAVRNVRHPRRTGSSIEFGPANDVLSFVLSGDLLSNSASTFHDTRARRSGRFVAGSSPSHFERNSACTESRARSRISRDGDGASRDATRSSARNRFVQLPPGREERAERQRRASRSRAVYAGLYVRTHPRGSDRAQDRSSLSFSLSLFLSVAESPGVAVAHVRRTHRRNGGSRCGNAQSQAPFR